MQVRATDHPISGHLRAFAALVAWPAGCRPRPAHPEGCTPATGASPFRFTRRSSAAWLQGSRAFRPGLLAPANRGLARRPSVRALSTSAGALASIGTPLFACEHVGACDALAPKGSSRTEVCRLGWTAARPDKPGLHRPTRPGSTGTPGPNRAPSRAHSPTSRSPSRGPTNTRGRTVHASFTTRDSSDGRASHIPLPPKHLSKDETAPPMFI